jgi:thiamine-monophosphate kinase
MTLSDVGELGLLAELERRGLVHGIENDAAQIGGLVVTQDTLVEGVHFRLGSLSWRDLGWRAAAVNISDLAACGARPLGLLVSLAAPGATALDDVIELYEGIAETGVAVRGGDTTAAAELAVSVTAVGVSERVPGRSGARAGDLLVVTGPLGAAGAAFRSGAFVRPPLRTREGQTLAKHAHAMLDISDGLAVDAAHLARRSRCRVEIELDSVPLAEGATIDDLAFGEDYELLVAVDRRRRRRPSVKWTGGGGSGEPRRSRDACRDFAIIGRCVAGEGVRFTLNGEPYQLAGWQHYRNESSARS